MAAYFAAAPPADAAWAVFFLTGRRLKRLLPYASINGWTLAATGLPQWMLEECYSVVGDGAETAALVLDQLPSGESEDLPLARWVEDRILPLKPLDPLTQQERVTTWWRDARSSAALHPAQASDRRAPRRRLADARRTSTGAGSRPPAADDCRPDHGRMDAIARVVYGPSVARTDGR